MLNNTGFDQWADCYDQSVKQSEINGEYPFAGYSSVLSGIYEKVYASMQKKNNIKVLDIGFGTGVLTERLYRMNCHITGIDFSEKMIAAAQEKMPEATLLCHDFSKGLPAELCDKAFDFIISTYVIHHLSDNEKVLFIEALVPLLKRGGSILIGDVSFETRSEFAACKEQFKTVWDEDEIYLVANELCGMLKGRFVCQYHQLSHCAGLLSIQAGS